MSKNNYEKVRSLLQEYGQRQGQKKAENDRMTEIKEELETICNQKEMKALFVDDALEIEGVGAIRYGLKSEVHTTKKFSLTKFYSKFRGVCDIKLSLASIKKMIQDPEVKKEFTAMGVSIRNKKEFKVEPLKKQS
ncbi:MAG: hypothetical protein AAFY41_00755 [Bacteroidota bacterium]